MKTKYEIIDEVASAYNTNTRALNKEGSSCQYETEDGKNCAVGRYLDPSKINRRALIGFVNCLGIVEGEGSSMKTKEISLDEIPDLFLPECQGHELDFWSDLQVLHDYAGYWSETGLSERGKKRVKVLKQKWEQN